MSRPEKLKVQLVVLGLALASAAAWLAESADPGESRVMHPQIAKVDSPNPGTAAPDSRPSPST